MPTLDRFKYLVRARPFPLEKPVVLQFPVIDICNSQCQMCYIWKNKKDDVILPETLREILSHPLFDRVRTVGINGGEPTLRKDLGALTHSLFQALPRLRQISLITNAYRVEEVVARISEVGDVVSRFGGALDVMVSLDGVGDVHDRIRGKPGNFDRALQVLDRLRRMSAIKSLRIGCTVIKENIYGVHDLLDFCIRDGLYVKYRLGIPHKRLYTDQLSSPFILDKEERNYFGMFLEGLIRHYELDPRQRFFYRSLANQILLGAPRIAGCDWQHRGATLSSRGELLYCAVASDVIGRSNDADLGKRYFGARPHLDEILRTKCDTCLHDYMGVAGRRQQLRELVQLALDRTNLNEPARTLYERSGLKSVVAKLKFRQIERRLKTAGHFTSIGGVNRTRPIVICGWYGTETLGDKAILAAIVTCLKATRPRSPIVIASLHPHITRLTKAKMPELADTSILDVESAIGQAGDCEALIFGGGPIMAVDEIAHMRTLFRAAAKNSRPRLVAGCGVGPLGPRHHVRAIRDVLALANARIFRDSASRERAEALGITTRNDEVTEDPAFGWVATQLSILEREAVKSGPPTLVLGLRALPWSQYASELGRVGGRTARSQTDDQLLITLAKIAQGYPDLRILPVPMCLNAYGDDDRWYYRDLFRQRDSLLKHIDWSFMGREQPPSAYLAAFCSADVVLAMRFHSLVFALGCGIPTIAIDYTMGRGKVTELALKSNTPTHTPGFINCDQLEADLIASLSGNRKPTALSPPAFPGVFSDRLSALLAA